MAIQTVQVQRKLFTIYEYEQMIQAGVWPEDYRLELIAGEIVEMSPIGGLHIRVVNRLNSVFAREFHERAIISVQNPIRLADSEPQPDLVLLGISVELGETSVPTSAEVLLLVEVADTTAAYDRGIKLPLYATSGIPEVWLIDLTEHSVEVYREPAQGRYKELHTLGRPDGISPLAFPDIRLNIAAILGAA